MRATKLHCILVGGFLGMKAVSGGVAGLLSLEQNTDAMISNKSLRPLRSDDPPKRERFLKSKTTTTSLSSMTQKSKSKSSKSGNSAKKSASKSRGCKSSKSSKSSSRKKTKTKCDNSESHPTDAPILARTFAPSPVPSTQDYTTLVPTTEPTTTEQSTSSVPTMLGTLQTTSAHSDTPSSQESATFVPTVEASSVEPSAAAVPTMIPTFPKTTGPTMDPSQSHMPSLAPVLDATHIPTQNDPSGELSNLDLGVCRCDEANICVDAALPRGADLRLCFSVSQMRSIEFIENLSLNQIGFITLDILLEGLRVHDEADLSCDGSRQSCVVSIPLGEELFVTETPPDILAKGNVVVRIQQDSRILRRRRKLDQITVPFNETIKLEKSEFRSSADKVGDAKTSSITNVRMVYGICIALVTGAVVLAFFFDYAVFHAAGRKDESDWEEEQPV